MKKYIKKYLGIALFSFTLTVSTQASSVSFENGNFSLSSVLRVKYDDTLSFKNSSVEFGQVVLFGGSKLVLDSNSSINFEKLTFGTDIASDRKIEITFTDGVNLQGKSFEVFTFNLIEFEGSVDDFFTVKGLDFDYSLAWQGNSLVLTSVPEPSTYAFLGGILLAGIIFRKNKLTKQKKSVM